MPRIRISKRLLLAAAFALLAASAAGAAFAALVAPPGLPPKLDPAALGRYFLGNSLVRAEIVVRTDALHDYWIDQGHVVRGGVTPNSLKLKEKTGDVVTIPVASNAMIRVNGRPIGLFQIKPGYFVLTIRDGQASPATVVRASPAR